MRSTQTLLHTLKNSRIDSKEQSRVQVLVQDLNQANDTIDIHIRQLVRRMTHSNHITLNSFINEDLEEGMDRRGRNKHIHIIHLREVILGSNVRNNGMESDIREPRFDQRRHDHIIMLFFLNALILRL